MKYLIMECKELCDSYECDADRTPIAIVGDWKTYKPDAPMFFEVYEILDNGKIGRRIKEYNDYMEEGMALYYWDEVEDAEEDPPHIVYKYPDKENEDEVPAEVIKYLEKGHESPDREDKLDITAVLEEIDRYGCMGFWIGNNYYVYGGYNDGHFDLGF